MKSTLTLFGKGILIRFLPTLVKAMQSIASYVLHRARLSTSPAYKLSNIFIPNDSLRRRFIKEIDRAGYSQLNTMGIVGCEGPTKWVPLGSMS